MIIYIKNLDGINNYEINLKKRTSSLNQLFEPFRGRLNFNDFFKIFNFENNIYEDKKFKYSIISNFNKRIIPELVSGVMACLTYEGAIDLEIRTKIENYMIAIMSNMDYTNIASYEMIPRFIEDYNKLKTPSDIQTNNFLYVIGTCPTTFSDLEYDIILNERINAALKFIRGIQTLDIQLINHVFLREQKKMFWQNVTQQHLELKTLFKNPSFNLKENDGDAKLTNKNLLVILDNIKKNLFEKETYNLILVCSTAQIIKLAIEIEKIFYGDDFYTKPKSIVLVGADRLYNLVSNEGYLSKAALLSEKSFGEDKKQLKIYNIKKLQSFLFELFLHVLDKNKFK